LLAQGAAEKSEELTYEEKAAALDAEINALIADINQLKTRQAQQEGPYAAILSRRIEENALSALDSAHQLVELVIEHEAAGGDPGPFRERAVELLETIPEGARRYINELANDPRMGLSAEAEDMSVAQKIALEADRERLSRRILTLEKAILRNLELSRQLGLDITGQQEFLAGALADMAENQSVALEMAQEKGATLSRQAGALPADTDLAALTQVNNARVKRLSDSLRETVAMMETLELDVVHYRQQLIGSAGSVTTDIFNFEVLSGLIGRWFDSVRDWIKDNLPQIFFNVLLFLAIVWIALTLSRIARKLTTRGLDRAPLRLSRLLRRMIISTAANLVLLLGLLFGLAQLGISVGPLLAGLGIAGFIVGFALQDTLGNFASGMLILLYRPYDVGDMIEAGGALGKVSHMSLVNTTILTVDNQTLVLPNSKIWGDVIKNVTAQRERRIDLVFGIGYSDDIPKAEKVLNEIVESHSKVLKDPEPVVRLHTLGESSVDFVVRPWVKTDDYWDVYWDITRAVKMRFDEEEISIPFPQRDVHIFSGDETAIAAVTPVQTEQPKVATSGSQPRDDVDGDSDGGDEGGDDGGDSST
jgi:small conductance mechanosensitive channel